MFTSLPRHSLQRTPSGLLGRVACPAFSLFAALFGCMAARAEEAPAWVAPVLAPVVAASPQSMAPSPLASLAPDGAAAFGRGAKSPVSAAAPAPGSSARLRQVLALDAQFAAAIPSRSAPRTITLGDRHDLRIILPRELRPSEAMAADLRKKVLESQRVQLYGGLSDMREFLDDDFMSRERSRAAESVMGSVVEKALAVAFTGGVRHESSVSVQPEFTTVDRGFKVDASPSWSYKVKAHRSSLRLDLPLTPRPIRLQAWRDLRGTDRTAFRLGGGVSLDPFDQSVRCGLSLEF